MQVTLGTTELRTVVSILEKQIEWNANIAVRVVTLAECHCVLLGCSSGTEHLHCHAGNNWCGFTN